MSQQEMGEPQTAEPAFPASPFPRFPVFPTGSTSCGLKLCSFRATCLLRIALVITFVYATTSHTSWLSVALFGDRFSVAAQKLYRRLLLDALRPTLHEIKRACGEPALCSAQCEQRGAPTLACRRGERSTYNYCSIHGSGRSTDARKADRTENIPAWLIVYRLDRVELWSSQNAK